MTTYIIQFQRKGDAGLSNWHSLLNCKGEEDEKTYNHAVTLLKIYKEHWTGKRVEMFVGPDRIDNVKCDDFRLIRKEVFVTRNICSF